MQEIRDLQEILSALQEIGNAWQAENVKLKAENERLADENKNLREEQEKLRGENEQLRQEIANLSGKMAELNQNLRDEIVKELAVTEREKFRTLVEGKLGEILVALNVNKAPAESPTAPQEPPEPDNSIVSLPPYAR